MSLDQHRDVIAAFRVLRSSICLTCAMRKAEFRQLEDVQKLEYGALVGESWDFVVADPA